LASLTTGPSMVSQCAEDKDGKTNPNPMIIISRTKRSADVAVHFIGHLS
jgi:hypothetical protein